MASSPRRSSPTPEPPAKEGEALCLADAHHCYYTVCLPARMAEAAPALQGVAQRLQAILQLATLGTVPLTTEQVPRSLFLLIDLDPHPAPPVAAGSVGAYALQQQGRDILISGKTAAAVACGVADVLCEAGFRLGEDCTVTPPPTAGDGRVVWPARDRIELQPSVDPGWLRALGVGG